jgi:hypothetical protein
MSRRRKSTGRTRCRDCGLPIVFFRSQSRNWRTYQPRPVNGRTHVGPPAYPIDNGRAWHVDDLVEELMIRLQYSREEATNAAYAVPWHIPHTCRTTTTEHEE